MFQANCRVLCLLFALSFVGCTPLYTIEVQNHTADDQKFMCWGDDPSKVYWEVTVPSRTILSFTADPGWGSFGVEHGFTAVNLKTGQKTTRPELLKQYFNPRWESNYYFAKHDESKQQFIITDDDIVPIMHARKPVKVTVIEKFKPKH